MSNPIPTYHVWAACESAPTAVTIPVKMTFLSTFMPSPRKILHFSLITNFNSVQYVQKKMYFIFPETKCFKNCVTMPQLNYVAKSLFLRV